jgi:hypothetical protein
MIPQNSLRNPYQEHKEPPPSGTTCEDEPFKILHTVHVPKPKEHSSSNPQMSDFTEPELTALNHDVAMKRAKLQCTGIVEMIVFTISCSMAWTNLLFSLHLSLRWRKMRA